MRPEPLPDASRVVTPLPARDVSRMVPYPGCAGREYRAPKLLFRIRTATGGMTLDSERQL